MTDLISIPSDFATSTTAIMATVLGLLTSPITMIIGIIGVLALVFAFFKFLSH